MLALPAAARPLTGTLALPGDKSMSHRALLLAAMARGDSLIHAPLAADDVGATRAALTALGVRIETLGDDTLRVTGQDKRLRPAAGPIDCRNAGTCMRLLAGVLTACNIEAVLVGDASLMRRPMRRLVEGLRALGAHIETGPDGRPPLTLRRHQGLRGQAIALPVPSAQLASALLLAGLGATGDMTLSHVGGARDHTERMLRHMGVAIAHTPDNGGSLHMAAGQSLSGRRIDIPGDPSSAAYWLAAAAIVPGSDVHVTDVSLNPTRLGFVRVLQRMGADITLIPGVALPPGAEPRGAIRCRYAALSATAVAPAEVPGLIDELPLFAVVAALANGHSEVRGAAQLRVKESDRIATMCQALSAMGARIAALPDGFVVDGPTRLVAADVRSSGDHRVAMSLAVAALAARGQCHLDGEEAASVSYPSFWPIWRRAFSGA